MAARVNTRIWPNAFVCLQKVHRLSKADRAVRAKINTYHPDSVLLAMQRLQSLVDENVLRAIDKTCQTHLAEISSSCFSCHGPWSSVSTSRGVLTHFTGFT